MRLVQTTIALAFLWGCAGTSLEAQEPPVVRLGERLEQLPGPARGGFEAQVDLGRLETAERIGLELDGSPPLQATRSRLEHRGHGDLLWSGRSELGEAVVLTVAGGRLAGTVFGREATYQILPFGSGGHRVLEVDSSLLPECGTVPSFGPSEAADGVEAAADGLRTSTATVRAPRIDVLIVYAAKATAAVGSKRNMKAVIQHDVDLTNVAFHNSGIDGRIRLVHSAEVAVPEGGVTPLDWVSGSAEVAQLRSTYGADLVGLVHEGDAGPCGSAAMIYRPGGPTLSRAFFESRRICGAATFAHEVGHLLGADHDPANAVVASGEYIYGRGHLWDNRYRTLMSYATACAGVCPQQPFFSNPDVRFDGRATGLRNERDNARILNGFAGSVEGFDNASGDSGACALAPGDEDFCLECGPCGSGEGNCETDSDCGSGLACAVGAGADFGFGKQVNVCLAAGGCALAPGDPDYCRQCGPCGHGAGDCDSDRECQGGLSCLDDVGETYGLAPSSDVCALRDRGFCPLEPGDPDYCSACGPCEVGEGNCKGNFECAPFVDCVENVGAELGLPSGTNVCLRAAPADCPFEPGSAAFCKLCGVCDVGEGDCDGDRECRAGLECVDGAGTRFGFGEAIDVCLVSEGGTGSGAVKAPKKLKAKALSPSRVRLRWKDKSKDEDGFHVESSREGGAFIRIAKVDANRRKLILEGLDSGGSYTFRVQAFNALGTSDYTNEVTVTTP